MSNTEATLTESEKKTPKAVAITVNDHAVTVAEKEQAGLEIKLAAIAQGVRIAADYVLYEITKKGRNRIPDDKTLKVNNKSEFEAIPDDVNS